MARIGTTPSRPIPLERSDQQASALLSVGAILLYCTFLILSVGEYAFAVPGGVTPIPGNLSSVEASGTRSPGTQLAKTNKGSAVPSSVIAPVSATVIENTVSAGNYEITSSNEDPLEVEPHSNTPQPGSPTLYVLDGSASADEKALLRAILAQGSDGISSFVYITCAGNCADLAIQVMNGDQQYPELLLQISHQGLVYAGSINFQAGGNEFSITGADGNPIESTSLVKFTTTAGAPLLGVSLNTPADNVSIFKKVIDVLLLNPAVFSFVLQPDSFLAPLFSFLSSFSVSGPLGQAIVASEVAPTAAYHLFQRDDAIPGDYTEIMMLVLPGTENRKFLFEIAKSTPTTVPANQLAATPAVAANPNGSFHTTAFSFAPSPDQALVQYL